MNQPTEPEFLDDVGLKKPDRSAAQAAANPFMQNKAINVRIYDVKRPKVGSNKLYI